MVESPKNEAAFIAEVTPTLPCTRRVSDDRRGFQEQILDQPHHPSARTEVERV
jgi:hypothetical protein